MLFILKVYLIMGFIFSIGVRYKTLKNNPDTEIKKLMEILFKVTFLWGFILVWETVKRGK
jgi:hypothetical protein